jgi:hypothetical protein
MKWTTDEQFTSALRSPGATAHIYIREDNMLFASSNPALEELFVAISTESVNKTPHEPLSITTEFAFACRA